MKKSFRTAGIISAFLIVLTLAPSCREDDPFAEGRKEAKSILKGMSLREKIGQMFVLRPEGLAVTRPLEQQVWPYEVAITVLADSLKAVYDEYPVGGFSIYAMNVETPEQLLKFTSDLHALKYYPLLYMDEEGGRVSRIANNPSFGIKNPGSPYMVARTGSKEKARVMGKTIGAYLREYGLDIDYAPVVDVWSNTANRIIGSRSFANEPDKAAEYSVCCMEGLESEGIVSCIKHFPGHGDTAKDTHSGAVEVNKTWEEMLQCEIIPFKAAIDAGVRMVMTAHISAPGVTGDSTPATLSKTLLTDKLRKELGFKGIIITDGLEMEAITDNYTSPEACILAILAGADIIMLPLDYRACIDAVEEAVRHKRIPMRRINESATKVLALKAIIAKEKSSTPENK